jgi:hypothetical protein
VALTRGALTTASVDKAPRIDVLPPSKPPYPSAWAPPAVAAPRSAHRRIKAPRHLTQCVYDDAHARAFARELR